VKKLLLKLNTSHFLSYIMLAIFHWLNYVSQSDILLVFIHTQEFWLSFHTKLLLKFFDILPQIILILSYTVTAKIFKLSFFHTPIRFPESGCKNKGLSSRSQMYRDYFFDLCSKSEKCLYIYIYMFIYIYIYAYPPSCILYLFWIIKCHKKNSSNGYSVIIDSIWHIQNWCL
jgi:hypothetical protein